VLEGGEKMGRLKKQEIIIKKKTNLLLGKETWRRNLWLQKGALST